MRPEDLPVGYAAPGDLAAIPDGNGWIVGIIDAFNSPQVTVRWGDCERTIDAHKNKLVFMRKSTNRKERGMLVGRRFSTLDELYQAHRAPFAAAAKGGMHA